MSAKGFNMIIITGAAGFIGSCVAKAWREQDEPLVLVDDFSHASKASNLSALSGVLKVERSSFFTWLEEQTEVSLIIHLGARTDTTEFDYGILRTLNVDYSKRIWTYCAEHHIPLIYASSAATYGEGELGYKDDHALVEQLKPLNPYGESKNEFDHWALSQTLTPPNWYGLKFFNVYGPNEYHKGRMASVVYHAFGQISRNGEMKLFRSHRAEYKDGEQLRDFVYVKDVISVIRFLAEQRPESGLYNLGTGEARTFLDLVRAVFRAMDRPERISFIDTPEDIRDKYQYYTEADMTKLHKAGYSNAFTSLEEGVGDYVSHYLMEGKSF